MKYNMLFIRKIVLASAVAVLALIYACQVVLGSKSSVKNFGCAKDFDRIQIQSQEKGLVELKKIDGAWKTGSKDVDETSSSDFVDAIKNIRCLGIVEKSSDEASLERYGLTPANRISVSVFSSDKVLFSFEIGKDAAEGSQSYVRIGDGKEIYLCASSLRETFSINEEDIIKEEKSE